jgi:hypothetical protein
MLTNAQLDSDLAAIIADYPQSVTWKGAAYVCAADDLTKGRRGGEAGIFQEDTLNIHIRTVLFSGARPKGGEQVTYDGAAYRIVSAKTGPDDLMITLACEEITA